MNNYDIGYAEGVANALNSANCKYHIGHKHSNSCYTLEPIICGGTIYRDSNGVWWCSACRREWTEWWYNQLHGVCNQQRGSHNVLTCTKEENVELRTVTLSAGQTITDQLDSGDYVLSIEMQLSQP